MSKHQTHKEESQMTHGNDAGNQAENTVLGEQNRPGQSPGNAAEKANDAGDDKNAETQNDAEARQESPEEKIAGLQAKLADVTDQLLRKAADFENFRKRMNQEKQNAIDFANQSLFLDIIPIIDDFERAIQSAGMSKDFTALLEGVSMIEKRMIGQFEGKWGLKRYNSCGEPFDPNLHEALMVENSPEVTEATVIEDLMKGYMLKDRVIRAAKVKVAMPLKSATEGDE